MADHGRVAQADRSVRSAQARQRREDSVTRSTLSEQRLAPAADRPATESDDTLILLFTPAAPADVCIATDAKDPRARWSPCRSARPAFV
jgi:hypothetical protein